MERTILHCDLNGFYASVELLTHPEYVNVPMAVGGDPESRHGIILAKNEPAKQFGVKTAETIWQAKKKCPHLVILPPHHHEYHKYSQIVNEIYYRYTDLIEPFGIDESFLDVTGVRNLFGDGKTIADILRAKVKQETGLTISVGVSFNKTIAKLGSDYQKPDATTVITRENFQQIVHPLPVESLLFVGRSATAALNGMNIRTIGDLARSNRDVLIQRLGKMGEMIHDYANGIDDSPVRAATDERGVKSIGNGLTFRRNLEGLEDIQVALTFLSDEVATRMRKYGVKCRAVSITIKDINLKSISRQRTLERPTQLARDLRDTALSIIKASWNLHKPIRMLTVTGMNVIDENETLEQLTLFDTPETNDKQERLEKTIDAIRGRFGRDAVGLGTILQNDLGIGVHHDKPHSP